MSTSKFYAARKNPFDKLALGAKIPDGKATVSNALRVQAVKEFTCPLKSDGSYVAGLSTSVFMLTAGLINGVYAYKAHQGTKGAENRTGDQNMYDNTIKFAMTGSMTNDAGNNMSAPANSERCLKWRVVSQAMRLSLVNNADENDGWFEAVRVDPVWNADEIAKFSAVSTSANAPGLLTMKMTLEDELPFIDMPADGQWANSPTYVTGKLRDIHQYIWSLNSQAGDDHDFVNTPFNKEPGVMSQQQKLDMFDKNYDCIFIRVHARTAPAAATAATQATATGKLTKLVCHVVSNQELLFDENTITGMAATPCVGKGGKSRKIMGAAGGAAAPGAMGSNFGYPSSRLVGRRSTARKRSTKRSSSRKRTRSKRAAPKRRRRSTRKRKSPSSVSPFLLHNYTKAPRRDGVLSVQSVSSGPSRPVLRRSERIIVRSKRGAAYGRRTMNRPDRIRTPSLRQSRARAPFTGRFAGKPKVRQVRFDTTPGKGRPRRNLFGTPREARLAEFDSFATAIRRKGSRRYTDLEPRRLYDRSHDVAPHPKDDGLEDAMMDNL